MSVNPFQRWSSYLFGCADVRGTLFVQRDMCREIPHSATPNHWIGGLLFSVIALVFLMPVLMSYGKKPVRDKLNR